MNTDVLTLGLTPNPKQREFFLSTARHTAYGGARGGGKSWAMRTKFVLLALNYPGIQLLLMRRTMPELRENHIRPLKLLLAGIAEYTETRSEFCFQNGSRIKCGYCALENDIYQYQGQQFDVIGMEEATLFTEAQRDFIMTCNRPADAAHPVIAPRMYYTCNPGGVGHAWVKRLFIDGAYRASERPEDYRFIRANIYDNPVLLKADPDYVRALSNLPEELKRAHLYGDWDVLSGQYFSGFSREKHVIAPFLLPPHWPRFRAVDYGLDCAACVWGAADEKGRLYIYREFSQKDLVIGDAARAILSAGPERAEATFAPPDLFGRSRESGRTMADLFAVNALPFTPVRAGRAAGWQMIAEALRGGAEGPGLYLFENCRGLIHDLPLLMRDTKDPTDCATEPHEITHLPDALRYLVTARPAPALKEQPAWQRALPQTDGVGNFFAYGR